MARRRQAGGAALAIDGRRRSSVYACANTAPLFLNGPATGNCATTLAMCWAHGHVNWGRRRGRCWPRCAWAGSPTCRMLHSSDGWLFARRGVRHRASLGDSFPRMCVRKRLWSAPAFALHHLGGVWVNLVYLARSREEAALLPVSSLTRLTAWRRIDLPPAQEIDGRQCSCWAFA